MKDISKYIEELLYRHQCVIIPDFGAFISNRKSATISENKTFSPPSKMLTFNSRLVSNDGLLIKHISETEKIGYEVAQAKVRQTVIKWKKELASGEIINFNNVGTLQQSAEGKITFLPSNETNLLTDSFGMSSFVPQEAEKTQEKKQPPVINTPVSSETKVKKILPDTEKERKKSKGYLKYAAIIILGIIAISYGTFSYFNSSDNSNSLADENSVQKQIENHISEATFLSSTPLKLPSVSLNVVKGQENKIETTTIENPSVTSKKEEVSPKEVPSDETQKKATKLSSDLKFHVIAGAFKNETNAKTRVKQLQKKGYKAAIVGRNSRGLYQVCFQSFKTQSEAEKFSKDIKINKKLDSWILETK